MAHLKRVYCGGITPPPPNDVAHAHARAAIIEQTIKLVAASPDK